MRGLILLNDNSSTSSKLLQQIEKGLDGTAQRSLSEEVVFLLNKPSGLHRDDVAFAEKSVEQRAMGIF